MCEKILSDSQSCADILGVISLPIELAQSEQSSFIQLYMNKKDEEHNNRYEKMLTNINDVNMTSDENIKQCRQLFKEEMNLLLNNEYLTLISDIQSTDEWFAVSEDICKRSKQIKTVKDEYFLDIKDLEQLRFIKIKDILRDYKEEAIKLRLCSPDETDKLVEDVIIEFNKKTVSNAQYNEDCKLQTILEVQQYAYESDKQLQNKSIQLADIRAQKLWKKIKEKQSQRLVIKTIFNLSQENVKAREEISQATSRLVMALSEFAEVLKAPTDVEIDEDFWKQWIGLLNTRLESLESLFERVHLLFKTAITSLLETFDNKINSLLRTLYPNVEVLSESICTDHEASTEIQILKEEQAKELKIINDNWQEIMDALSKKINQSKVFVSDLTLIWTNHTDRRNKLTAELKIELENQKRKWLNEESIINIKIKRQIKDIREAKDLCKLDHCCAVLENTFADLKDKWERYFETQIQKMEAVRRNKIQQLIEEQMSDIREFIFEKYPKNQWFDESFSLKLKSSGTDQDSQIEMCNTYMKSVDNRTLGMHEMLERYLPACPYAIMDESDDWLYNCMQDMVNKYEFEFDQIAKKHEETIEELKQTRLAELQIHSDRLLSHSCGVKSILTNLNKQYEDIKLFQHDEISTFNEKLHQISQNHIKLSFSKQIKEAILQINHDWAIISKSLESSISEAKIFCFNQIKELNDSNSMFCKNAKIFKNGGNYSPEELKWMKKEISQLKKLITRHNKALTDNYNKLSKNITSISLDSTISELQNKLHYIKLEEDLIASLNATRLRLWRSASNIREMGDTVEQKINQLKEVSEKWLENVNTLDNYNYIFKEVIDIANKRADDLKPPNALLTPESFLNINKTVIERPNAGSERANTEEIETKPTGFLQESKEYILSLFFNMDQNIHKVFISAKGAKKETGKTSRIPDHHESDHEKAITNHTIQLKSTLLNYYEDCKAVCIHESQNHLEQMIHLHSILNSIIKQSFYNVHKICLLNLNDLEKCYDNLVEQRCEVGAVSRNKIQRNLVLPLAHPNHIHKLNELLERAKDMCVSEKKDYVKMLSTYKGKLQSMHDKYVEKIALLRKNFEEIQTILPNIELLKINLPDISVLSFKNHLEHDTDHKIDQVTYIKYPLSIWSKEESVEINNKLTHLLSTNKLDKETTGSHKVEQVSAIGLATENLKMSAVHIQQLYDQARYRAKQCEEANKRWLHSFKCDMNQAKLIHTKV